MTLKGIMIFGLAILLCSCDRFKEGAKEAVNKTGETVGKGTSIFVDGVKEGIDHTFHSEIHLSDTLRALGISTGKFAINKQERDTSYRLSVYFIYANDLNRTIHVRVLDQDGREYGRSAAIISGSHGQAGFVDFIFERRTDLESKSRFELY